MKIPAKRIQASVLIFLLVVGAASTSWWYFNNKNRFHSGEDAVDSYNHSSVGDSTDRKNRKSNRLKRDPNRRSDVDVIQNFRNASVEELIILAPKAAKLLSEDQSRYVAVSNAYRSALYSMTPQQVADLLEAWPKLWKAKLFSMYRSCLTDNPGNEDKILTLLNLIEADYYSKNFVVDLARRHEMFSMKNLKEHLDKINTSFYASVGNGVYNRILNMPESERLDAVDGYYAITRNPELVGSLAEFVVKSMVATDVNAAREWLLSGEPKLVKAGDHYLIQAYEKGAGSNHSIEFLNELIRRNQPDRAYSLVRAIAVHDRGDAKQLFKWGLSLPQGIEKKQEILLLAYRRVWHNNAQEADNLVNEIRDEALRKSLQNLTRQLRK